MLKVLLSSFLIVNSFALELNSSQKRLANFIYNKTYDKQFAFFLIAQSIYESSLDSSKINKCDLKYKGKCYDSLNFPQINMHTAKLLYPNIKEDKLYKKLKSSKLFALQTAKKLYKANTKLVSKKYQNDTKKFMFELLKIYRCGLNDCDNKKYGNSIYNTYIKLKRNYK